MIASSVTLYTSERSSWYLLGMRMFGMADVLLPHTMTAPSYFNGERVSIDNLESEGYRVRFRQD